MNLLKSIATGRGRPSSSLTGESPMFVTAQAELDRAVQDAQRQRQLETEVTLRHGSLTARLTVAEAARDSEIAIRRRGIEELTEAGNTLSRAGDDAKAALKFQDVAKLEQALQGGSVRAADLQVEALRRELAKAEAQLDELESAVEAAQRKVQEQELEVQLLAADLVIDDLIAIVLPLKNADALGRFHVERGMSKTYRAAKSMVSSETVDRLRLEVLSGRWGR